PAGPRLLEPRRQRWVRVRRRNPYPTLRSAAWQWPLAGAGSLALAAGPPGSVADLAGGVAGLQCGEAGVHLEAVGIGLQIGELRLHRGGIQLRTAGHQSLLLADLLLVPAQFAGGVHHVQRADGLLDLRLGLGRLGPGVELIALGLQVRELLLHPAQAVLEL